MRHFGTRRALLSRPAIVAAGPQVIVSNTLDTDIGGLEEFTMRVFSPVTGGNLGRVRVTFKASTTLDGFRVNNASFGKWAGSQADTVSTPNELLFSSASGFALTHGQQITSDWVTPTDTFSSSDKVVIIFDISVVANSGFVWFGAGAAGQGTYFKGASASYNAASTPGGTSNNTNVYGVLTVETGP